MDEAVVLRVGPATSIVTSSNDDVQTHTRRRHRKQNCFRNPSLLAWTCLLLTLRVTSAITYTAPEDCKWKPVLNGNEVALSCHLQTIVSSGVLATNFSLVQAEHTSVLSVFCEPVFFESSLPSSSMSHLKFLKSLSMEHCKFRELSDDTFRGLGELRNLSVRTFNSDWGAYALRLHSGTFAGLRLLESLDLGYNKINKITRGMVCGLHSLKLLNLTHNDLEEIFSDNEDNRMHHSCINDLVELDVSANFVTSVNRRAIESFTKLRVLNLKNNRLKQIEGPSFSGFSRLQKLDFSFNQLETLHPQLLQDSPDLREIYLTKNYLTSLPTGLLTGLQQLLVLDLSYNRITSDAIGTDTFIDLIRLVILDLRHNRLQYINSSIFQSQYSLQMLYLSHNSIDMISDNSFSSLYNLHTLDLSHNSLKYMDAFTLNGLYVISTLQLSHNEIFSVHTDAFKNCSSIQDLSFEANLLMEIPSALRSLQFLKKLNLANNTITGMGDSSFKDLKQLTMLNVSMNQITNLTKGSFPRMTSLERLDLSSNHIVFLEHGVFDESDSIHKLDLSHNELSDMNGLFMNLKTLKHLNVSRNKITWFDYALIPTDLDLLDLHDNKIDVLGNYYELESTLPLRSLDASDNLMKEINDGSFPNRIRHLDLSHNKIVKILTNTFKGKTNLSSVDLSHNILKDLDINTFSLGPTFSRSLLPDFYISGNPYFCDCNMEWLQHINKMDGTTLYPHIADMDQVSCGLAFTRQHTQIPLVKTKPSDFLCKYRSHCFALCHCCEFDACDCEMVCPDNCTCFSDQTWNTNIVDCSRREFSSMPSAIPMDVTDLYLDGNDISQLTSHTFIGRKNMKSIYLNNSNIHVINNRTFNGLLMLQILHLENNRLNILQGYEFETLVHLRELYLSHNSIGHIANITFQNLKSLEILHIHNNMIKDFQVWNLNWNTNLNSVQLGNNPYSCNCQYLESYHEWLNAKSALVRDTESIKCRQNRSTNLLEFNLSRCSNMSESTYFQAVFQADYMPMTIIVVSVSLVAVLLLVVVCVYRRDMKVWLYSKFGLRLFERKQFAPEAEKLFDAFVCYSKKDESFVAQFLAPELECGAPSYRLCLRYRDLPMSGYVAEAITDAIECSRRTIVVLSEQFLRNDWCQFELKSAHRETQCNRKHKLIVVVLDKLSFKLVDPETKMCFRNAPVIRWGDKRFWEKLRYSMPQNNGQNTIEPKMKFPHQRYPQSNSVKLV